MVKVTVKQHVYDDKGFFSQTSLVVKEHEKGNFAHVYNGVLSVYADKPEDNSDLKLGIAGYEPGSWESWEKV